MLLQQLAIFVENKMGKLSEITKTIAAHNINLRALCIAETADYGILRVIVDCPEQAYDLLKAEGCTVTLNDMVVVRMADHPGSLSGILETLAEHQIGVAYLYAFLAAEPSSGAYVALRIDDDKEPEAIAVLKANGCTGIDLN